MWEIFKNSFLFLSIFLVVASDTNTSRKQIIPPRPKQRNSEQVRFLSITVFPNDHPTCGTLLSRNSLRTPGSSTNFRAFLQFYLERVCWAFEGPKTHENLDAESNILRVPAQRNWFPPHKGKAIEMNFSFTLNRSGI